MSVVAAYGAYALLAVPWIEPQATFRDSVGGPATWTVASGRKHQDEIAKWFPADAWELKSPKVLTTDDQGKLLFQDYKPLDDGRVEVKPFTLVFFSLQRGGSDAEREQKERRPIIMRAPEGAVLQFDRDLDLRRVNIGRLVGGRLLGEIRIFSPESQTGAGDHCEIVTRNIQIDQQRVWTPHDVRFRTGPHYGSGRDLSITLLSTATPGGKYPSLAAGSLKSLELVHVDAIHLLIQSADKPPTPAEITCRGPFQYDFQDRVASFEEQVDVMRHNADGPSDQLNCHRLEIHFRSETPAPSPTMRSEPEQARSQSLAALEPSRLVATGNPVIVRAPSAGAHARGQRLEYDFQTQLIFLEDQQRVTLEDEHHLVTAVRIQYEIGESGRIGRLWAQGPGNFRGLMGEDRRQIVEATWGNQLLLRPHELNHVLSMTDAAGVKSSTMGGFTANEIHLWLNEVPQSDAAAAETTSRFTLQPQRMMALGQVRIDTPQLTGSTQRLEAWFESEPPSQQKHAPDPNRLANSSPPSTSPGGLVPETGGESETLPDQRFDIVGDLVRIQLFRDGQRPLVNEVTVEGGVRFTETMRADPHQAPLRITGNLLQLRNGLSENPSMRVTGQMAQVAARGMIMSGAEIQLKRGANRLWIEGPGQVSFPARRDVPSQRADPGQRITVDWKGRMDFDGRTVHFERDVKAHSDHMFALSGVLDVALNRGIDFAKPDGLQQVDVRQFQFDNRVFIENRSFSDERELISIDQLQTRNLSVDQFTGWLHADGPGWVSTVRYGSDKPLAPSAPAKRAAERPNGLAEKRLTYVHIDFQKAIVGNLLKREIQLLDRVKAIYGPVDSWDTKLVAGRREDLGQDGALLTCDRLTAVEMNMPWAGRRAFELQATGNAVVEGRSFTARGERISYADAKQLVVLEGDGRSDAELWRQTRVGGPTSHAAARKILYWRSDNRIEVDDARFLDLSQFGATTATPQNPPGEAPPPNR